MRSFSFAAPAAAAALWTTAASAFAPMASSPRTVRLHSAAAMPEGISKTVLRPGRPDRPVSVGDIATVKYSCFVADEPGAFAKAERQKMVVGEGTMIPAWDRALRSMTVGESATIAVTNPKLGYGEQGVPPLVPPNAALEFSIEVLDVQPPSADIGFDTIALADTTPTTPAEIAAAFERRQAEKLRTQGPKKEGLEGFIEKARGFYFFGLFEGETGERAPWFLRPSITFPIAFLIVGAAFAVSFATGSIYERGAAVTDELDEIILTNLVANIDATARAALSITSEHLS